MINGCHFILGIQFGFEEMPVGGAALDLTGVPLPEETLSAAKQSHAILLGAIGGSVLHSLHFTLLPILSNESFGSIICVFMSLVSGDNWQIFFGFQV